MNHKILVAALLSGFATMSYADAPPVAVNAIDASSGDPVRIKATSQALHVYSAGGTGPTPTGTQDIAVKKAATAATVDAESAGITADTTLEAATASLRLLGWTIRESAGTAAVATVILRHDTVATTCDGPPFAYIELDANQSSSMEYSDRGKAAASGVCADVIAGTVDVNISTVVEAAP